MAMPNGTGSTSSDPTSNEALGNIERWIENRDLEKGNNLVVALVGCGNMGSAILYWHSCCKFRGRRKRQHTHLTYYCLHQNRSPYMAEEVLGAPGVADALANKLVISVLAGSTTEQLKEFAFKGRLETISPKYEEAMKWVFQSIGQYTYVPDNVFQVAGVLAGCTPAWFLTAFDGILDGAVSEGMKRDTATEILAGSMLAAAKMIQNGEHPAVLREKISSPREPQFKVSKRLRRVGQIHIH
ncbi:hypothetical protein DID88_010286 [Monilinia fructigena]|uniref:Pyrroline-5-carboxylate reductase dimerisation domain-containing protein n=1 Tax=Monilinia fructigena TaxID=38457 RepID=A0A395ILQ2_9HELO|nr:hypothetical protein DID88_010286 [Monilinia fructigena]